MPPRSSLIDLALDIVVDDDLNSSTTSFKSFVDVSKFKRSQSQLLSASTCASRIQHMSKSVRFDEYDKVKEVAHVNNFSQKKLDRLWFSPEERSETRKECLAFVRRFNAGEVIEKDAMLGLEKQTKASLESFTKHRRIVNDTVFSLQNFQQGTSVAQPSLIAKFYEKSSVKPALQARLSALKLAMEVKTEIAVSKTMYRKVKT